MKAKYIFILILSAVCWIVYAQIEHGGQEHGGKEHGGKEHGGKEHGGS